MSRLPPYQNILLTKSLSRVAEATIMMNELNSLLPQDGSIRSAELAKAGRKLNEVFGILSLDDQVNNHETL